MEKEGSMYYSPVSYIQGIGFYYVKGRSQGLFLVGECKVWLNVSESLGLNWKQMKFRNDLSKPSNAMLHGKRFFGLEIYYLFIITKKNEENEYTVMEIKFYELYNFN